MPSVLSRESFSPFFPRRLELEYCCRTPGTHEHNKGVKFRCIYTYVSNLRFELAFIPGTHYNRPVVHSQHVPGLLCWCARLSDDRRPPFYSLGAFIYVSSHFLSCTVGPIVSCTSPSPAIDIRELETFLYQLRHMPRAAYIHTRYHGNPSISSK